MTYPDSPMDAHSPFRSITHIRTNPGMYVGNTQAAGMRNAIDRLQGESFDEAKSGHGRLVCARLSGDGLIEIADDGRSPLEEQAPFESASAHTAFTEACWGFRQAPWRKPVPYCVVANAISDPFEVEFRDGDSACRMTFRKGELVSVLRELPPSKHRFTIAFRFDSELFGNLRPDGGFIHDRLRELAMLNSGVRTVFEDSEGKESHFQYENGIRSYVEELGQRTAPLHPDVLTLGGEDRGVVYDISLQWCSGPQGTLLSFMNDEPVPHGGTHITGLRTGLSKTFNEFARMRMPGARPLKSDELLRRLNCVISLRMDDPIWEGATRSRLGNPELRGVVQSSVRRALQRFVQENPDAAERIIRSAATCRNPIRRVECQHSWRTSTAVAIARGMFDSQDFSSTPLLADALEDAGCDNTDILEHCRDGGPHTPDCWVVDLLTG